MTAITTPPVAAEVETFDCVYLIPDSNYPRLEMEIEKLNKVCAKLGLPAIVVRIIGSTTSTVKCGDKDVERTTHSVRVIGSVPKLPGWSLVARLEHLEAGTLVCGVPGVEVPAQYQTATPHCDHCATQRKRKDTFVLFSKEHGYKQVGRQCIADFLGHGDPQTIAKMAEWVVSIGAMLDGAESGDDWGYNGGGRTNSLDIITYASACAAIIRTLGFVSGKAARESEGSRQATGGRVWAMLTDFGGSMRDRHETQAEHDRRIIGPATVTDVALACAALTWARSLREKQGCSSYESNIAVLAGAERVESKHIGFVASIIPAYQRALESEAARAERMAKAAERPASQFAGTVGKREVFDLTVTKVIPIEGWQGSPSNIVLLADQSGNVFKWKCDNLPVVEGADGCLNDGDRIALKATVKEHVEYASKRAEQLALAPVKQTVILRGVLERVIALATCEEAVPA